MTREEKRLARLRVKNAVQFIITALVVAALATYLIGSAKSWGAEPALEVAGEETEFIYYPEIEWAWEDPMEEELIYRALLEQKYLSDEIPLSYDLQDNLRTLCEKYGIPYSVALAVIQTESTFNPAARNGSCYGYMQINTCNLSELSAEIGVTDLTDPLQNIRSGVHMLAELYEDYGDWHKALIAYNCGRAGAYMHYFQHGYTTSNYSRVVMARAEDWAEVVGE